MAVSIYFSGCFGCRDPLLPADRSILEVGTDAELPEVQSSTATLAGSWVGHAGIRRFQSEPEVELPESPGQEMEEILLKVPGAELTPGWAPEEKV
jgi:hypothetical protein